MVGFHDALRKKLGQDGIRVSVIEPGAVWTEFGENVGQALRERRESRDALTSEDVAQALVYAFAQPPCAGMRAKGTDSMGKAQWGLGIIGLQPGRSWAAVAHVPALSALADDFAIIASPIPRAIQSQDATQPVRAVPQPYLKGIQRPCC